ncbi:hypothetical protein PENNAL_c0932G10033, partial [Penicillium nalgiovense]
ELGRSLEAVTPQTLQVAQLERDHLPREESGPAHSDEEGNGSFTAKIRELECANNKMKNELDRTSIHLQESLGENRTLHTRIRQLQDELDSNLSRATQLEDELVRVSGGITKAMQVLQEQHGASSDTPRGVLTDICHRVFVYLVSDSDPASGDSWVGLQLNPRFGIYHFCAYRNAAMVVQNTRCCDYGRGYLSYDALAGDNKREGLSQAIQDQVH